MNKKLISKISILLIAVIILSLIFQYDIFKVKAATATVDGIVWNYTLSGSNIVKLYTANTLTGEITIPEVINGYKVTGIGGGTSSSPLFTSSSSQLNITKVNIPDSVSTIQPYCFDNNTGLKGIILPENLATIGNLAFQSCTSLETVIINSKEITSYPSSESYVAFKGSNNIKTITLGENVVDTPLKFLFYKTTAKNITLNFNCKNFTGGYFTSSDDMGYIGAVNVGENVTKYDNKVVNGFIGLKTINYNAISAAYSTSSSSNLPTGTLINIGENVTKIQNYAFKGNNLVINVASPTTVFNSSQSISGSNLTFYSTYGSTTETYCNNYNHTFYDINSVGTEIIDDIEWKYIIQKNGDCYIAPSNPSSLTGNVVIPAIINGMTVKGTSDNAFNNNRSVTSYIIPDTIEYIGDNAFYNNFNVTEINIPSNLKEIGDYAFYMLEEVTDFNIPSGTKIGQGAFSGTGISQLILQDGTTEIREYEFSYCNNLKNVVIPSNITSIGYNAFSGCNNLESILIPETVTYIDEGIFGYETSTYVYGIKGGYVESFCKANNLTFLEIGNANIEGNLTNGGKYTYNLETKVLTISGTTVDYNGLTEKIINSAIKIVFEEGITTIKNFGVYGEFENVTEIEFPSTLRTLSNQSFRYYDSLATVKSKTNNISIGSYSFPEGITINFIINTENEMYSSKLADYVKSKGYSYKLESISSEIVKDTNSFTYIPEEKRLIINGVGNLPDFETYFADTIYYNTDNLVKIQTNDSIYYKILKDLIYDVEIIELKEGINGIGVSQFVDFRALKSITIPNTVKYINRYAFVNCISLETLELPESIEYIQEIFAANKSLTDVYVYNRDMLYKEIGVSDETHNTPLQTMHGTNTFYKDTIKVHGYWESTSQYFCYNRSSMFDVTKETIFSPIDTGVKIEYHFNNIIDRTKTEFTASSIGTEINSFTDYETETLKVTSTENLPLVIKDNNYNIIKVFLEEIKPELPKEVSYTIINYFDSVADTSKNQTGTTSLGNNIIAINLSDNNYEIDNSKTTSLIVTITEADQIINIYYKTKTISEPEEPDGDWDTIIHGTIIPTIIDVTITLKVDITINKKDIIANELFITNNGETNIKVSFSGLTNNSTIENVMPSKFGSKEDWYRQGSKNSSKYIALGFNLKENNYKETFKSDIIYFKELEDTSFDLGILQPNKTVSYDIQGSHGVSFKSDIKFNSRLIPMFSLED